MPTRLSAADTIAAVATPPGRGGIGILRLSGPDVSRLAALLAPPLPRSRVPALRRFLGRDGEAIDRGLAIFFPSPGSYTGEDVLELHAHGAPAVLEQLLAAALAAGARAARPGEFTERAFLNGRLDLAQAEAVADLIEAGSAAAAKAALASLEGRFSREIQALAAELLRLRVEIEARLDFPDDEFDRAGTFAALHALRERLRRVGEAAASGRRLAEGFVCVLAGAPNVGKSSLLNALAGSECAIVTELPGTTRDPIEVDITLDGLALRLVDTAGLRNSDDRIEAEGVRRARERAAGADLVLEVHDERVPVPALSRACAPRLLVINKIDLSGRSPGPFRLAGERAVAVSATTGAGLEDLAACLCEHARGGSFDEAAKFSARRRHLDALSRVSEAVSAAMAALASGGEVAAEELRRAQSALGEITGEVGSEDLLGAIFSSFCLGK